MKKYTCTSTSGCLKMWLDRELLPIFPDYPFSHIIIYIPFFLLFRDGVHGTPVLSGKLSEHLLTNGVFFCKTPSFIQLTFILFVILTTKSFPSPTSTQPIIPFKTDLTSTLRKPSLIYPPYLHLWPPFYTPPSPPHILFVSPVCHNLVTHQNPGP